MDAELIPGITQGPWLQVFSEGPYRLRIIDQDKQIIAKWCLLAAWTAPGSGVSGKQGINFNVICVLTEFYGQLRVIISPHKIVGKMLHCQLEEQGVSPVTPTIFRLIIFMNSQSFEVFNPVSHFVVRGRLLKLII